jgi:hypothetical protein
MRYFAMMILLVLVAPDETRAAPLENCGFSVEVVDNEGRSVLGVPVALIDGSGVVRDRAVSDGTRLPLCNVGVGYHSIVAGENDSCGFVTVGKLSYNPYQDNNVRVTVFKCPHLGMEYSNRCKVSLLVKDRANGRYLPEASVRARSQSMSGRTNAFGRMLLSLEFGTTEAIVVSLDGFEPDSLTVGCERGISNYRIVELGRHGGPK